jgi:glycerol uptake facilitator-like aquaporin
LAQVFGALFGSAIVYGNYVNAINTFEGGNDICTQATASLFATYSVSHLFNLGIKANLLRFVTQARLLDEYLMLFCRIHRYRDPCHDDRRSFR